MQKYYGGGEWVLQTPADDAKLWAAVLRLTSYSACSGKPCIFILVSCRVAICHVLCRAWPAVTEQEQVWQRAG